MEHLLKSYASKRRDAGAPAQMHPATRRLLQDEVARARPRPAPPRSWFSAFLFSPRLVGAAAMVVVLGVGYWSLVHQQTVEPTKLNLGRSADFAEAPSDPISVDTDRLTESLDRAKDPEPSLADVSGRSTKDAEAPAAGLTIVESVEKRVEADRKALDPEVKKSKPSELFRSEAMRQSEALVAQNVEDRTARPTPAKPDGVEMQLGKAVANQPMPATQTRAESGSTRRRDSRISPTTTPPQPAAPVAPSAPVGPAATTAFKLALADNKTGDAGGGAGLGGKEKPVLLGAAVGVPASDTPVPTPAPVNLQLDGMDSLSLSYLKTPTDLFAVGSGTTTLSIVSGAPGIIPGTTGYLTNATLGSVRASGPPPPLLQDATPLPALPPAEPVAGEPLVSNLGLDDRVLNQSAPTSRSYYRFSPLREARGLGEGSRQRFRQQPSATATVTRSGGDRLPDGVMASFEFEQTGARARVIDQDGSVYEGQLLGEAEGTKPDPSKTSPAPVAPTDTERSFDRNLQRTQDEVGRLSGQARGVLQQSPAGFRLQGTNRTLRRMVVVEGRFVSGEQQKTEGTKVTPPSTQSAVSAQQMRGTVRIGDEKPVPFEALPARE